MDRAISRTQGGEIEGVEEEILPRALLRITLTMVGKKSSLKTTKT